MGLPSIVTEEFTLPLWGLRRLGDFAQMVTKSLHARIRFLVAGISVLLVLRYYDKLCLWGSYESEGRWLLLQSSAAAVAVVFLTPVLMRGDRKQRILALALIILPVIALLYAFLTARRYDFEFLQ